VSQTVTIRDIARMKREGEKIAMVTAYDYTTAYLVDQAGVPIILVGDSLGMVVLGYRSTIPVTMEDMIHHIKAVSRGSRGSLIVGDMPFMTYQIDESQALLNATRFLQEGGAHAVKLEGGEQVAETVRRIVATGIPVLGHIGLTPQSVNQFGGYRVRGNTKAEAAQLLRDAIALQEAGAFGIVLELVPSLLSKLITEKVTVPTIGIGSGPHCDGQVQVINDIMGLFTKFIPKHTKQYARLSDTILDALKSYMEEVRTGKFPTSKESFGGYEVTQTDTDH